MTEFGYIIDQFEIKRGRVTCVPWLVRERPALEAMVRSDISVKGEVRTLIEVQYYRPGYGCTYDDLSPHMNQAALLTIAKA